MANEFGCKGNGSKDTVCEYDGAWFCKNPDCKKTVLTSTLCGAIPSGCPLFYEWNSKSAQEK